MPETREVSQKRTTVDERDGPKRKGLLTTFGNLLHPLLRSKLGWVALTLFGIFLLSGMVMVGWWLRQKGGRNEVAAILKAVETGDWAAAHKLAEAALGESGASPESLRAALFAQLAAYAAEADRQTGVEKRRLLLLAAQAGDQAAVVGFPPGREAEGFFLLGRTLHYLSRFAESRKYLREAARLDPQKQIRINWLMSESHLLDPQGNRREALQFNQAFLLTPGLDLDARNAGYLQQSRIHLALDDPVAAEKVLKHLSPRASESPEADLIRGQIALCRAEKALRTRPKEHASQPLVEARAFLERVRSRALADEGLRAKAAYLLGKTLFLAGEYESALSAWKRCYTEFADYPDAWAARFRVAELNHRLSQYDRAVEELTTCLKNMGDAERFLNPWVSIEEVQQSVRKIFDDCQAKGLFALALKITEALGGVFPAGDIHELRAKAYLGWGESLEAAAMAARSQEAQASSAEARRCFRLAGDEFTRLARFRAGTRFYTEDLWQAGDCYFRGRCFSRASRVLREYLRNEARRRNPQALLRLGECLLATGKTDDALRVLYECIEFHAKDAASYRARLWAAYAHMDKAEFDRAENVLVQNLAGELAPTSLEWRDSLFALGILYFRMERDAEAQEKLEEALRRYPNDPRSLEARYLLAELHVRAALKQSRTTEALLATGGQSAKAREHLLLALQEYQRVQQQLDSLWDAGEPGQPERKLLRNVYFGIGDVCYRLGRFGDAINAYMAITHRFQVEPEVLEAYRQIARCYRAMGRPKDSRIALEQARIVLNRVPPDVRLETSTPFTRDEWKAHLGWFENML